MKNFQSSGWQEVTKRDPCPICSKPNWCSRSNDRMAIACRRKDGPNAERRLDVGGQDYFLYRIDKSDAGLSERNNSKAIELKKYGSEDSAGLDLISRVYNSMLDLLSLTDAHQDQLLKRGLDLPSIKANRYRSLSDQCRSELTRKLYEMFGDDLLKVPGFCKKGMESPGEPGIEISARSGILIPNRAQDGSIRSMMIRSDSAEPGKRYTFLSSKSKGGPGADAAIHFPYWQTIEDELFVTEGPLKADIAYHILKKPFLSIPGVSGWRKALLEILMIKPKKVYLAYDADHRKNPHVARNLAEFLAALRSHGISHELVLWDSAWKGIDDLLVEQGELRFLGESEYEQHLNSILKELGESEMDWASGAVGLFQLAAAEPVVALPAWGDPQPLPTSGVQVPEMNLDLIPEALKVIAKEISERLQAPLEYAMVPLLIAVASAIGRQLTIRPKAKDVWTIVVNLWGALVGRPSSMKSPAQNEGLRALKKIASEHLNDFQAATIEWKATETVIISQKKGIEERLREIAKKGENDPSESNRLRDQLMQLESRLQNEKPRARRLYTSDGTVEKISEILVDNPNGILINRDELYGFLKANDKPGREGDRAFYLESWNGYGEFTVDRIGRGTILVPALCLSILGGIQPGRLQQYVAEASGDGAGDDGLIQRFQLLVWPEFSKDWKNIDRPPNEEAAKRLERLFRDLVELKLESVGATWNEEGDPPYLRFAPDAQEAFNLWLEKLESRLRGEDLGSPALDAHLGKYRKLMPALALIFHVLDVLSTGKSGSGVSLNAVQLAERWCSHLELHARKVYGLLEAAPVSGAQELLKRIRSGAVKDRARVRSIYRRHWTGLNSEEAVNDALDVLEQYGWVKREVDRETGGAPSVLIRIHPTLNNGGVA